MTGRADSTQAEGVMTARHVRGENDNDQFSPPNYVAARKTFMRNSFDPDT